MTCVFAASLLVTIPHAAWLTAPCHGSDCSLPASQVPASKNGPNEPTLPDHTWDHFFLVGTIPRSIRIYVPNLVMIGPAVWPPILDRHTHTHTHTEFVLYRYRCMGTCMCICVTCHRILSHFSKNMLLQLLAYKTEHLAEQIDMSMMSSIFTLIPEIQHVCQRIYVKNIKPIALRKTASKLFTTFYLQ